MPIAKTNMHRKRLIAEAETGVMNLQASAHRNAATHKQWATDESIPLSELQQRITDTIAAYESIRARLRTFRDVTIQADPEILTVGAQLLADIQSVGDVGQQVADHIDVFAVMPRTTYVEIIAACDYLIANVNPPESVWD